MMYIQAFWKNLPVITISVRFLKDAPRKRRKRDLRRMPTAVAPYARITNYEYNYTGWPKKKRVFFGLTLYVGNRFGRNFQNIFAPTLYGMCEIVGSVWHEFGAI